MNTNTTSSTELLAPVWTHLTDIQPVRGEGIYLYDEAGNRYTDFTSGIGVINTGHCHPEVVNAVQVQAKDQLFGQIYTNPLTNSILVCNHFLRKTKINL